MQVAAFCTSRETSSKPQNLQNVLKMDDNFDETFEQTYHNICKYKVIKMTILLKDKIIKNKTIFVREKMRPGHEVAGCNEFHVGVLVSLSRAK